MDTGTPPSPDFVMFEIYADRGDEMRLAQHINNMIVGGRNIDRDTFDRMIVAYEELLVQINKAFYWFGQRPILLIFEGLFADSLINEQGHLLDSFSQAYRKPTLAALNEIGAIRFDNPADAVSALYESNENVVIFT